MVKRRHPYTVHFNVQYIKYLFYIQVWEISAIQRSLTSFSLWSTRNQHCDPLWISIVVCIVFAVYEYYICIVRVHLTFWGFMASGKDYFTLFSHGKQEQKRKFSIGNHLTICRHNEAFSQAVRMGSNLFRHSSGRPTNINIKNQIIQTCS